jgi:spoIIIJ-associated protein
MVWFAVVSNDSKLIIGKNGETLEAFNHIARKIVEQKEGYGGAHTSFVVDVNDYQKKKTESIKTIAHMMAERARFFKASVEIEPMNAFERKIVHTFLESAKNIKTESVGQGPSRHVVIRYIEE